MTLGKGKRRELADRLYSFQQQARQIIDERLENLDNYQKIDINNLPCVQQLILYLDEAFPESNYPRNGYPPAMRSVSGIPRPYDQALTFGCPENLEEEAVLGWVLLLMGHHPTDNELYSLTRCCNLFIDAYLKPSVEFPFVLNFAYIPI